MRFNKAYAAAPLGTPNTASILTGKYPARMGITNDIDINKPDNRKLLEPRSGNWLDSAELTFAKSLSQEGYKVSFVGQWKFEGSTDGISTDILNLGFTESNVTPKGISAPPSDPHFVQSLTEKSIKFIKNNKDDPFLLFISHHTLSETLTEEESLIANYHEDPLSQQDENHPILGAMIERLDMGVGKLLQFLEAEAMLENTIIIFTSDNGADHTTIPQKGLKGGKGTFFEGGLRVPLIISWPGKIRSGLVNNVKISAIDLMPTILGLTDQSTEALDVDGIDLSAMLLSGKGVSRNTLYWHYPHYNTKAGMSPAGAIISSNYKLIEWYEGRYGLSNHYVELYDIEMDPTESENLVRKRPQKADELLKYLQSWRQLMGAKMPSERRINAAGE